MLQFDFRLIMLSNTFSLITLLFYFFVKNALTVIRVKFPDKCFFLQNLIDVKDVKRDFNLLQIFRCLQKRWLRRCRSWTRRRWRPRKPSTTFCHSPLSGTSSWRRLLFLFDIFLSGCYDPEEVIAKKDYFPLQDSYASRSLQRTLIAWRSSSATSSVSTISQMIVLRLR